MIYTAYIHQNNDYDGMVQFIKESFIEIDSIVNKALSIDDNIGYLKMFNESTNTQEKEKAEVSKSFIDKVGDVVLGLFKKIREIVDKCQKLIYEKIWSKKTDAQKIQKLINEYPSLSDRIVLAINEGDLDIKDINSMQDLTDGTIDLMEKLKIGKIDQSEFEKKFNKLYDNYKRFGKPIVDVITGVSVTVGTVIALKKFKTEWLKTETDKQKLFAQKQERNIQVVNEVIKSTASSMGQNTASVSLRAWSKIQAENGKNLSGLMGIVNRSASALEKVVSSSDKLSDTAKKGVDKLASDSSTTLNNIKAGKERSNRSDYDDTMRRAEAQAIGKKRGEDIANKKN